MKTFRDQLRTDGKLNPFNPQFDHAYLRMTWTDSLPIIIKDSSEDAQALFETCNVLQLFNQIYILVSKKMHELIVLTGMTREGLSALLLSQHNASHLWVIDQLRASFQGRTDFDLTETFGHQTPSRDAGVGNINTGGGLATSVDILQMALNFVEDSSDVNPTGSSLSATNAINYIYLLVKEASVLFGFKTAYECAIWNGGYIRKRNEQNYLATFPDKTRLMIEEIGRFRLQMDHFAMTIKIQQILSNDGTSNVGFDPAIRKDVCIRSVAIKSGTVTWIMFLFPHLLL